MAGPDDQCTFSQPIYLPVKMLCTVSAVVLFVNILTQLYSNKNEISMKINSGHGDSHADNADVDGDGSVNIRSTKNVCCLSSQYLRTFLYTTLVYSIA